MGNTLGRSSFRLSYIDCLRSLARASLIILRALALIEETAFRSPIILEDPVVGREEDREVILRHFYTGSHRHLQVIKYFSKVKQRLEVEKAALRGSLNLEPIGVKVEEHVFKVSLLHSMRIIVSLI